MSVFKTLLRKLGHFEPNQNPAVISCSLEGYADPATLVTSAVLFEANRKPVTSRIWGCHN